jgi:hypothetical protein
MFYVTDKGRDYLAHHHRPRGGNAPWVRGPAFVPVRRRAAPSPAA